MVSIRLYNYSKKLNSTAVPSGSGAVYNCLIKDDRSLITPVILLDFKDAEYVPTYNYCFIPGFNRYYYINDWVYVRGLWQASLLEDHLASFRADIGQSVQYIRRSSRSYDGDIIDSRYPFKTGASFSMNEIASGWQTSMNAGFFVLSVAGGQYGTTRYALTPFQMYQLASKLYDDSIFVMDPDVNLDKNTLNPIEYINNILWYPINTGLMPGGTAVGSIPIGWWDSGVSGVALTGTPVVSWTWAISVPKHPQTSSVGNWLNGSAASSYELYYHPYGAIVLDPTQLKSVSALSLINKVDVISGMSYLSISAGGAVIRQVAAQVAVPVQVVQNHTDAIAAMSSSMGAVASLMTGNVAGFRNGISNALMAQLPQVEMKGASGSMAGAADTIKLVGVFLSMTEEDIAHKGRPLMQSRRIDSIPGYIECEDVHLTSAIALKPELENIYNDMRGGFYYE